MVELRKRKDPPPAPAPATKRKSTGRASKAAAAIKEKVTGKKDKDAAAVSNGAAPEKAAKSGPPTVGDTIDIDGFGGEVETNDGEKTTLKKLVDDSDAGVVIFTYPKASTPGCTFLFPLSVHFLEHYIPSRVRRKTVHLVLSSYHVTRDDNQSKGRQSMPMVFI